MAYRKKSEGAPAITCCDTCFDRKHPGRQHLHFLQFADERALAGHLRGQYGETAENDGRITAILSWVRSIQAHYSDLVDEIGVRLPVWQAWARTHQSILSRPRKNDQGRVDE